MGNAGFLLGNVQSAAASPRPGLRHKTVDLVSVKQVELILGELFPLMSQKRHAANPETMLSQM